MTPRDPVLLDARRAFHKALLDSVLKVSKQVPSNADKDSRLSRDIALGIVARIGETASGSRLAGQIAGKNFEVCCANYLANVFGKLRPLRPGNWEVCHGAGEGRKTIADFHQYTHLAALEELAKASPELSVALGSDYLIKPDIVIVRYPDPDDVINREEKLVDLSVSRLTPLREVNQTEPILHASISCKWTMRSDRAQNSRSEGLNLVRNRKGRLPHIAVVTAEPMPSRIASIALGTGDVDCVYHFALDELRSSVEELDSETATDLLRTMIEGQRLRDVSDLPLDLII